MVFTGEAVDEELLRPIALQCSRAHVLKRTVVGKACRNGEGEVKDNNKKRGAHDSVEVHIVFLLDSRVLWSGVLVK